jgi:hypothetical protein
MRPDATIRAHQEARGLQKQVVGLQFLQVLQVQRLLQKQQPQEARRQVEWQAEAG